MTQITEAILGQDATVKQRSMHWEELVIRSRLGFLRLIKVKIGSFNGAAFLIRNAGIFGTLRPV